MKQMFVKRKYEKPSMKVYELRQQPKLLAGSDGDGGLNDYNRRDPANW